MKDERTYKIVGAAIEVHKELGFIERVFVFFFHFSIDFIRCQAEMKVFGSGGLNFHKTLAYLTGKRNDTGKPDNKTLRTWFAINVVDQTAHVASLYAIVKWVIFGHGFHG